MIEAPDLRLEAVDFSYADGIQALNGVSLHLRPGSFTALIGQNGSGKTTLARHLNGLQRPDAGRVLHDGENIQSRSPAELARAVGYCFQNPDHQIFRASVHEEIAFGPENLGVEPDRVERRVQAELSRFNLTDVAARPPATLSYGQRRLVSLAAVFAMRTPVLILDEPTQGLDQHLTDTLVRALRARHQRGATVVLISHDVKLVAAHAPRTALLHAGTLAAHGPTLEILADPSVMAKVGIEAPPLLQLTAALAEHGHSFEPAGSVTGFCRMFEQRMAGGRP